MGLLPSPFGDGRGLSKTMRDTNRGSSPPLEGDVLELDRREIDCSSSSTLTHGSASIWDVNVFAGKRAGIQLPRLQPGADRGRHFGATYPINHGRSDHGAS